MEFYHFVYICEGLDPYLQFIQNLGVYKQHNLLLGPFYLSDRFVNSLQSLYLTLKSRQMANTILIKAWSMNVTSSYCLISVTQLYNT